MKNLKLTLIAAVIAGVGISGVAQASDGKGSTKRHSNVVDDDMSRIDADAPSGNNSGTVNANCSDYAGQYDTARASLEISQKGSGSGVEIEIKDGRPNTLYTVWVRMKGQAHGTTFGGSPMTGGGATPLAHTDGLVQLVADWVGPGSANQPNGFRTNSEGEGEFDVDLDFPVVGGAYPFNRMPHDSHLLAQTKNPAATPSPTAIVNPADVGIGPGSSPFMIRVVSHCQDDTGHGLSPATREPWFQYP